MRWTHGEQISLAANEAYWKPGIPKVERVTFRFNGLRDLLDPHLRA